MKKKIIKTVVNFPKKNEAGFLEEEINEILKSIQVDIDKFNNSLSKIEFQTIDNQKLIYCNDLVSVLNSSI
jgi:hypothetical protein